MPRRPILSCMLLLILTGCLSGPSDDEPNPVWPPAPEQPRIQFERSVGGAQDVGIRKSLLTYVQDVLTGSKGAERFSRPMAALEQDGVLYVADPGLQAIHRLDQAQGRSELLFGSGNIRLPSVVGLTAGPQGLVYVTDSKLAQVFALTRTGEQAQPVRLEPPPQQPTGIAYDPDHQHLLVSDTAAHVIRIYDQTGQQIRQLGQRGSGDGQFNYPTMVWRTATGMLLVTDSLNFRIQAFDSQYRFLWQFGKQGDGTGDMNRPKGIASDKDGNIYVVDSLFHVLQIFSPQGQLLLTVGEQGGKKGQFWLPTGLFISDQGRIYVADSQNRRIQILNIVPPGAG